MKKNVTKNVKQIMALTLSLFLTLPHFVGGGTLYAEVNDTNKQTNIIRDNTSGNQMNVGLPVILGGTFKTVNPDESDNSTDTDIIESETVEEQVDEVTDETETVDVVETESPEVVETEEPSSELVEEPLVSENKSMRALTTGTVGTVEWTFDDATGVLTFGGGTFPDDYVWRFLLDSIDRTTVTKVVFEEPVIAGNTLRSMFSGMTNLTEIVNLNLLNTSNTTDMYQMFYACHNLTAIDCSGFDTSNVTTIGYMFYQCTALTELDLSSFDTSKANNMKAMFYECKNVENIDVSTFNTSNVTDMSWLFWGCNKLTSVDVSNFDTSNVTDMNGMFYYNSVLETVDVSNWNVSKVRNIQNMFANCFALKNIDVSNWDTSSITDFSLAFSECRSLETVDVSNWNTMNAKELDWLFAKCVSLVEVDVSNWDVSNVTNMNNMFLRCSSLPAIDVSNWNIMNVKDMGGLFKECASLTDIAVTEWNTSSATSLRGMFSKCTSLTELDLNRWNTSNVTDMDDIFNGSTNLASLKVSDWDTSKVTTMKSTFSFLRKIFVLDISNWDNSNAVSNNIFGSSYIKEITMGDKFENKATHYLNKPSTINAYDGNWEYVPTGALVTVAEIESYGSAGSSLLPGTYVWRTEQFELSYDLNYEGGTDTPPSEMHDYYDLVTKPTDPVRPGYTFIKWTQDAAGTVTWNFGNFRMPANNLTLYAQWSPNTDTAYKVEHYQEQLDGTYVCVETENLTGTTDTEVEATIKTFEGYSRDAANANNVATGTIAVDGSLVLKSYYTLNTYTVRFRDRDGIIFSSTDLKFGEKIIAPAYPPIAGYAFTGWAPKLDETMPANDVMYTARYGQLRYVLTFRDYDGRIISDNSYHFGAPISAPADPIRPGYTFTGWTPEVAATMPMNPVTHFAQYTANTDTAYKVEHYQEQLDGTYVCVETENLTGTTDTEVEATIKTFEGYSHDAANANSVTTGTIAGDGSLVLKVYYTLNTYKVTFNDRDGIEISTANLKFGEKITAPTYPFITGYSFTGWAPKLAATMPASDVTYTATYGANQAVLAFKDYDGRYITGGIYSFGTPIFAPANPTREGYTFTDWKPKVAATMPAYGVTHVAQYTANTDTAYNVEHYQEQLDGSYVCVETENLTGTTDTTVDAVIKTYDGYTQDAANANSVITGTVAANGSLVLKVYYTLNTYTVTFNNHDGSKITSEDLKFGADITAPIDPERAGYTFTGWTPAVAATMPANNVTYTAEYTANTNTPYKVEHYQEQLDGSYTVFETVDLQGISDTRVEATVNTYDGFTVDGNNAFNKSNGIIEGDGSLVLKVYYARNVYNVTFRDFDNSVVQSLDLKFGAPIVVPADPKRTGFTFTGWTPTVEATMPANDLRYSANYTATDVAPYIVEHHLETQEGTFEVAEVVEREAPVHTTVRARVREYPGYTYDNRNPNANLAGPVIEDGSLVLKAYYKINTYNVTFKDFDGNELFAQQQAFGSAIVAPADPKRDGYKFAGWTPAVDATVPDQDVTYTATYTLVDESKPVIVNPITDDGGPFTTDDCGTITDRWGNVMYKPSTCLASTAYKVPNTGVK